MLRVGFVHKPGTDFMVTLRGVGSGKIPAYQTNDQHQVSQALKGIEKILKMGYRKFFFIDTQKNYPAKVPISTMHNSAGICGFASGATQNVCKYWTRKSIDEKKKVEEKVVSSMVGATTTAIKP
jgi:adenosine/AMP kinase